MAETYHPFDAGAGANIVEAQWRAMARHWVHGGSGVLATELNALSTVGDSTGMQVKMATGRAWVAGHFYENDALKTLAISSNASGNPRIDRVVIRNDFSANTIGAVVITGTPAGSPTAPALTQSTAVWDIPLAQVAVANGAVTITAGNVTDERGLVSPLLAGLKSPSTTARDLLTTTPVAGMTCRIGDVGYEYNGSAWVETGRLSGSSGTWTPQVDQGVTTNIAKTVSEARYVRQGNLVTAWFLLNMTGTGTATSLVTVTLPLTAVGHQTATPIGSGLFYDSSTGVRFQGVWEFNSTTTIVFGMDGGTSGALLANTGAATTVALGSSDSLRGCVTYTVA